MSLGCGRCRQGQAQELWFFFGAFSGLRGELFYVARKWIKQKIGSGGWLNAAVLFGVCRFFPAGGFAGWELKGMEGRRFWAGKKPFVICFFCQQNSLLRGTGSLPQVTRKKYEAGLWACMVNYGILFYKDR